jgi:hypothetical protein
MARAASSPGPRWSSAARPASASRGSRGTGRPAPGRCWRRPRLGMGYRLVPAGRYSGGARRRPPSPARSPSTSTVNLYGAKQSASRAGARHRPRHLVRRLRGDGWPTPRHAHRRTPGHPRSAPPRRGRQNGVAWSSRPWRAGTAPEIRAEFRNGRRPRGVGIARLPRIPAHHPGRHRRGAGPGRSGLAMDQLYTAAGLTDTTLTVWESTAQAGHRGAPLRQAAHAVRHRPHGGLVRDGDGRRPAPLRHHPADRTTGLPSTPAA